MEIPIAYCGLLVLCLGTLTVHSANCPNGWSVHEQSCFLFKKETYNWFDALRVCTLLGGYLAEDDSISKHQFLNGLIQTHGATSGFAWIGLQDFAEENVFKWTQSGGEASPSFWGPGEPEDRHGEEDCVALHKGGWIDSSCEDSGYHFICQKPATEEEVIVG